MTKRGIVKMLLVAGVLSLPGPAYANEVVPIYRYMFWSDGTYTTQVGEDNGYCAFYGPAYTHQGQNTQFVTSYQIANCVHDDQYGWYEAPL